ncbi:MAG: ABC transporter permease, partial [Planctomycetes bacterium]|nr:ABC transporter permease [Planctomycetota bacterium]
MLKILFRKECRETIKDKKSLILIFFLPVILTPAVISFFPRYTMSLINEKMEQKFKVAVIGEDNSEIINNAMNSNEKFQIIPHERIIDVKELVQKKDIDVAIIIPDSFEESIEKKIPSKVSIWYDPS